MENYIGEIKLFAGNYAPQGWAICDGSLLNISEYEALFSLLSTTYGGDGARTFALPNLKGRVCVGIGKNPGSGPYGQNYQLGNTGGVTDVTLNLSQFPAHSHTPNVCSADANTPDPTNAFLATTNGNSGYNDVELYTPLSSGAVTIYMDMNAVNSTGAAYPDSHSNLMPFINLNYIIALNGLYPSQY